MLQHYVSAWTKCLILAKCWLAPWWWFPCKPKHVGAAFLILICFNKLYMCISWTIKGFAPFLFYVATIFCHIYGPMLLWALNEEANNGGVLQVAVQELSCRSEGKVHVTWHRDAVGRRHRGRASGGLPIYCAVVTLCVAVASLYRTHTAECCCCYCISLCVSSGAPSALCRVRKFTKMHSLRRTYIYRLCSS